jgi:hypothetical protein
MEMSSFCVIFFFPPSIPVLFLPLLSFLYQLVCLVFSTAVFVIACYGCCYMYQVSSVAPGAGARSSVITATDRGNGSYEISYMLPAIIAAGHEVQHPSPLTPFPTPLFFSPFSV